LVTSDPRRGRRYADERDIEQVASSLEELADGSVDVVYVGTTNERHRPVTEAAAARGWHVLVEKPMSDTFADAAAMVEACEAAGVLLGVNHHLVASGGLEAVRAVVASGEIGDIYAIRVEHAKLLPEFLRTWRVADSRDGGVLPDLTPHDASLLDAILAPRRLREVAALSARQAPWSAAASAMVAILRFDGDVVVTLHDAFTTPHAMSGVEVLGSQGSIWAEELLSQDPIARVYVTTDAGRREVEVDRRDLYEATIRAFVSAVNGAGSLFVDGRAGLRAARIASVVAEAAGSGKVVQL
jgi:1,5-anhydro-D-fructose reductase (1,5-anhydro-D-mannitol-forming)